MTSLPEPARPAPSFPPYDPTLAAQAIALRARAVLDLTDAGFTPASARDAVDAGDLSLLVVDEA